MTVTGRAMSSDERRTRSMRECLSNISRMIRRDMGGSKIPERTLANKFLEDNRITEALTEYGVSGQDQRKLADLFATFTWDILLKEMIDGRQAAIQADKAELSSRIEHITGIANILRQHSLSNGDLLVQKYSAKLLELLEGESERSRAVLRRSPNLQFSLL